MLIPSSFFIYQARLLAQTFFWVGVICFCFIFMADFFELARRAPPSLLWADRLSLVLLKCPLLFHKAAEFLILTTATVVTLRMNHFSESLAAKQMGLSFFQRATVPLLFSFGVGLLDVGVIQPMAALSLQKQEQRLKALQKDTSFAGNVSSTGVWLSLGHGEQKVIFRIGGLFGDHVQEMSAFVFDGQNTLKKRFEVARAQLIPDGILMKKVWEMTPRASPVFYQEKHFEIPLAAKQIEESSPDAQGVSIWRLPALIGLLEKAGISALRYRIALAFGWARPFLFVSLSLLCVLAAALWPAPRERWKAVVFSLGTIFFSYTLQGWLFSIALSGSVLPTVLAFFLPFWAFVGGLGFYWFFERRL